MSDLIEYGNLSTIDCYEHANNSLASLDIPTKHFLKMSCNMSKNIQQNNCLFIKILILIFNLTWISHKALTIHRGWYWYIVKQRTSKSEELEHQASLQQVKHHLATLSIFQLLLFVVWVHLCQILNSEYPQVFWYWVVAQDLGVTGSYSDPRWGQYSDLHRFKKLLKNFIYFFAAPSFVC